MFFDRIACLASVCFVAAVARGDLAPTRELPPDAGVDQVLDALDARGQGLKDFVADVKMKEEDPALAISSIRAGKVWFQNKGGGDARMRVRFDTRAEEGGPEKKDPKEYFYDQGWLVDRDYRSRNQTRYQVVRPGEKINLLKVGEGPFPLPIGQDKASVHEQFDVAKVEAKKGDPEGTIHLELKPKKGTRLARRFDKIDVWVDRKSDMPTRIETTDVEGKNVRTTELSNIRVNAGLGEGDFKLPEIDDSWSRHDEAFRG